jgi:tetratricopeptide (TPR) repeat protein
LRGLILLESGDFEKAIECLELACSSLPHEFARERVPNNFAALFRYALALAYFRAEKYGRANKEFERITSLTAGRLYTGDLYAKSFYWLGRIAEMQKDRRRAVGNYGAFLDLWKDADPGTPEVEEANKRLAALGAGSDGPPDKDKHLRVYPTGYSVWLLNEYRRDIFDFLDKYLGPVKRDVRHTER